VAVAEEHVLVALARVVVPHGLGGAQLSAPVGRGVPPCR
jgi:hypothetical protein